MGYTDVGNTGRSTTMSRSRRILIIVCSVVASPLVLVVLWIGYALVHGTVLQIMGYPVDVPPYELAAQIAAKGGDPLRCRKLQQSVPTMGPSLAEKRMSCIYEVAKLTLDPTVCELLLPGEYGLACLSEVGGKVFSGQPCHLKKFEGMEVYCTKSSPEGEGTLQGAQIDNCAEYNRKDLREWCWEYRTWGLSGVYECEKIEHPVVREECENNFAFKQKDPSLCSAVKDGKRRKYCEIRIGTWLKYPELRSSFYFGTPVPVDSPTGA